jgi:hypothetical protein
MAVLFASGHRGPAVDTLKTLWSDSRIFLYNYILDVG